MANKADSKVLEECGQATVEYLVVGIVVMTMVLVLGPLAQKASSGVFVKHASMAASHSLDAPVMGAAGDVILY